MSRDGNEYEALLPESRDFSDYYLRIGEVLDAVSQSESRSQIALLTDIAAATSDLLRFRAPDADAGTLPFDHAVIFVERCRDVILSAACAAWERRPYFGRRKPQIAMNYLNYLQMGQTERGSFVLTALSPVPPELKTGQASLFEVDPDIPFERQVTVTLADGLNALSIAAKSALVSGDMQPFEHGVSSGISANMCDAVAGLAAASPNKKLEFSIEWASNRQFETPRGRVAFDADVIPVLFEAGRRFRELEPIEDVEIEGYIIQLSRSEGATEGEIVVVAEVEFALKKITIDLPKEIYSQAVSAHQRERIIRCTGELSKEGRSWRLNNPRAFRILD